MASTKYRWSCCQGGSLALSLSEMAAEVREHRDEVHGGQPVAREGLYSCPADDYTKTTPLGRFDRLRARL